MRRFSKALLVLLAVVTIGFLAISGIGTKNSSVVATFPAPQEVAKRIPPKDVITRLHHFENRFGNHFDTEFTSDHRLSRVRAQDESAKPDENFETGDKDAALRRAEQVLKDAGDLIGLNSKYPLSTRAVHSDEISSQIEWVETFHGVPIEPVGRITIQLDQRGGLRGLYSNYISDLNVLNEPTMDSTAARSLALSHIGFTPDHPENVANGELVLFASGSQNSQAAVPVKYAYRFWVEGREIIVDSSLGEILRERDRRQF